MRASSVALQSQAAGPRCLRSVFVCAGLSLLGCGAEAEPAPAATGGAGSTALAGVPGSTGAGSRAGESAAAGGAG